MRSKKIKIWILVCICGLFCFCPKKFDLENVQPEDWLEVGAEVLKAVRPFSPAEETQLGRMVSARLAGTFGVWKDPAWTEYINLIGRSLAVYTKRTDIKYRFAILDIDEVNAYSAPGGYIFVSRGLLRELKSEAELACILGHELGHIVHKHVIKEVRKSHLWQAGAKLAIAGTELTAEEEEFLEGLTDVAWDTLVVKGFSKQDEYQADREGVWLASQLGYDPSGLVTFLKRLQKVENKPGEKLKIFFSTHPRPSLRIKQLEKFMKKKGLKPRPKKVFKEEFKEFKAQHPI